MDRMAYTVNEAARALGASSRTVYRLIERGDLRVIRLGISVRIPEDELRRFLSDGTAEWTPANRGRHVRCETKAGVEA